jgi:hypothetical protein
MGKRLALKPDLGKGVCMTNVEMKSRRGRSMMKLDEMLFDGKVGRGIA